MISLSASYRERRWPSRTALAQDTSLDDPIMCMLTGLTGSPPARVDDEHDLCVAGEVPSFFTTHASQRLRRALSGRGYGHVYSFLPLPSWRNPSLLLPNGRADKVAAGSAIYQPHRGRARVAKAALRAALRLGWNGKTLRDVVLASKAPLPLSQFVLEVADVRNPCFALSLGRQMAVRKLTIQVMQQDNASVVGYLKLPLTDAARRRVENEARHLRLLARTAALRPVIPEVIYAGEWQGTYVLFQSALAGSRGPLAFGPAHEDFLGKLRSVHSVEIPVPALARRVGPLWDRVAAKLGAQWEVLGRAVLRDASVENQPGLVCGVMHGDFAPWNTRLRDRELLLFDWESADWECPVRWDVFHFHLQSAYSLRKPRSLDLLTRSASDRISFMLFLLHTVGQFLEEESASGIAHCKQLLQMLVARGRGPLGNSLPAA